MLSARDAKLVKRYYLLPKAAWYSLVALFLSGGLAILLVMIDNIGLGSKGFGDLQLIAMAALMIAEGAVCIACGVVARRGLGSAHWQELEREAIGGNANIGTNPAVAGGIGVAAAVCIACGVVARRGLGSAHWQELEREAIGGNANIGTNPAVAGGIGVAATGRLVDTLDNDDLDALSTGLEIAGAAMSAYGFFDTMRRMSRAAAAVAPGRLVDTLDNDDLDALSTGLEIAGAAMSAYGFFDTMRRMSRAAAAVARAHGMELPGLGRTRLLVIGLPLLLLTLSFVPRFIDSAAQSSASQEASARAIQAFNAALEPVCSHTLADDPLEHRQDSSYRVSGNITDEDGDIAASISVETDELGAVDSVVYNGTAATA